jgi:hypothetical protein
VGVCTRVTEGVGVHGPGRHAPAVRQSHTWDTSLYPWRATRARWYRKAVVAANAILRERQLVHVSFGTTGVPVASGASGGAAGIGTTGVLVASGASGGSAGDMGGEGHGGHLHRPTSSAREHKLAWVTAVPKHIKSGGAAGDMGGEGHGGHLHRPTSSAREHKLAWVTAVPKHIRGAGAASKRTWARTPLRLGAGGLGRGRATGPRRHHPHWHPTHTPPLVCTSSCNVDRWRVLLQRPPPQRLTWTTGASGCPSPAQARQGHVAVSPVTVQHDPQSQPREARRTWQATLSSRSTRTPMCTYRGCVWWLLPTAIGDQVRSHAGKGHCCRHHVWGRDTL